jgi:hypothetical protein
MDRAVHDEILTMFSVELEGSWDDEEDRRSAKVCTLSDFFSNTPRQVSLPYHP